MCHKYILLSHRNSLQRVYVSGSLSDDGNGPFFFFATTWMAAILGVCLY